MLSVPNWTLKCGPVDLDPQDQTTPIDKTLASTAPTEDQHSARASAAAGLADAYGTQDHEVRQELIYCDWRAKQGLNGGRGADAMQQQISADAGKAVGGHSGTHAAFRTYLKEPEQGKTAYINQEKVQHNFNLSAKGIPRDNSPIVTYKGDGVPTAKSLANGPKVPGATPFAGPATYEYREFITDLKTDQLKDAIWEETQVLNQQCEDYAKKVYAAQF